VVYLWQHGFHVCFSAENGISFSIAFSFTAKNVVSEAKQHGTTLVLYDKLHKISRQKMQCENINKM